MSREDWRAAIVETVRRNQLRDATIRFIVTRGVPKAVVADPRDFQPTMIVWAAPYIFLADEATRRKGIRLFLSRICAPSLPIRSTRATSAWIGCTRRWRASRRSKPAMTT